VSECPDTGRPSYYDELAGCVAHEAAELLDVPSIGPARASLIAGRLGITALPVNGLVNPRWHRSCGHERR
jgi:hypothetical protein